MVAKRIHRILVYLYDENQKDCKGVKCPTRRSHRWLGQKSQEQAPPNTGFQLNRQATMISVAKITCRRVSHHLDPAMCESKWSNGTAFSVPQGCLSPWPGRLSGHDTDLTVNLDCGKRIAIDSFCTNLKRNVELSSVQNFVLYLDTCWEVWLFPISILYDILIYR